MWTTQAHLENIGILKLDKDGIYLKFLMPGFQIWRVPWISTIKDKFIKASFLNKDERIKNDM